MATEKQLKERTELLKEKQQAEEKLRDIQGK